MKHVNNESEWEQKPHESRETRRTIRGLWLLCSGAELIPFTVEL